MADSHKNSLDALRLLAAGLVLYSHQHVLFGRADPSFFGLSSFGGAGVAIFFFLSGTLVWSSWQRDPDPVRFFWRRCLRIFPALWVVVLLSVFCLGPALTQLPAPVYWSSSVTWQYLSTAALVVRYELPGVFTNGAYPNVVNGSLWTLPVEFLCYVLVAGLGWVFGRRSSHAVGVGVVLALAGAVWGAAQFGSRFVAHFEMAAFFWWGVLYQYLRALPVPGTRLRGLGLSAVGLALLVFALASNRGLERTGLLVFAAAMVWLAQHWAGAARLTERLGDLSYGMYIFAFPVQQTLAFTLRERGESWGMSLMASVLLTGTLAALSWHLVEKRALRLKPQSRSTS